MQTYCNFNIYTGGMGFFSREKKKKGSLAIAFGAGGVCIAALERQPAGRPRVALSAFYPAAPAAIRESLTSIGREVRADEYRCMNLLGTGEYQLLSVEAPNVPADELKTAVRWRLKDMLDFHVDDATIDVLNVPAGNSGSGRPQSMFAVAARNSLIQARQEQFRDAGMGLSVIDIPEMAQRNIAALLEPEGRGVALLSFDRSGGLLTVTYQGELYLARRVDVTLEQLQGDRQLALERVALELQRSLDHFDRQYSFINVSKLMLAPSGISGLADFLAPNLYVPVQAFELGEVLDLEATPELHGMEAQARHFLTLGAALRHEEVAL